MPHVRDFEKTIAGETDPPPRKPMVFYPYPDGLKCYQLEMDDGVSGPFQLPLNGEPLEMDGEWVSMFHDDQVFVVIAVTEIPLERIDPHEPEAS